ncbi:MAG: TonB-dependent receptor plug domain-containing protein [Gammaproteobacteria bacterium]
MLVLPLLALPLRLFAQDLGDLSLSELVDLVSLEDLANIVVTDTKLPQDAGSVTQNIVVLTADILESQPVQFRNAAEFLRPISGQFVNVLSRNDANWGSYGGLGPKYNSWLLDGLPIDSFVEPMSLDPWAFARVEAHKGPASVLYSNYLTMDFAGNTAPLAGTTNLILREHIDVARTRMQAGIGSHDTRTLRLYHQGRQGNLSYFGGLFTETSDYRQYGVPLSWLQTTEDPDYRKRKYYGKVSWQFDREDHTLSLFAHRTDHDGDMGRPNRGFDHEYALWNLVYANRMSAAWHLQFKAGERRYQRRFQNDAWPISVALTGSERTTQRIRPLDFTLGWMHHSDSLLTLGADYQRIDYVTDSRAGTSGVAMRSNDAGATSRSIYIQEKMQFDRLVLRGGLRHNTLEHHYALLGSQLPATHGVDWSDTLWSIGARWNLRDDLSLYANAGSSFMAPAAKQIGGTVADAARDSGQLPNPGLRAERGVGRDAGIEWQATSMLSVGLRLFHNDIGSAIVDNAARLSPSQSLAVNTGSAETTGLDLDLSVRMSDALLLYVNSTLTQAELEDPANADQDGVLVPFVPRRVANAGFNLQRPSGLVLSAYYQWVDRYHDSASRLARGNFGNYGVLNLRLLYPLLRSGAQELDLLIDLNNLGGSRHDLPFGFRATGFNGYAALDWRF